MPDWIAKLLQEWPLVAAAPIPFAIALVSIAAAILLAVALFYRGVLSKRADRQLLNHGDRPGKATAEDENTDGLERNGRLNNWIKMDALERG